MSEQAPAAKVVRSNGSAWAGQPPAPPFANWSLDDAKKAVAERTPKDFDINRLFVGPGDEEADHWQDMKGWVGPPIPARHPRAEEIKARVREQFTPRNAIGAVVASAVDAFLKREPRVRFELLRTVTPDEPETEEETALLAEANGHLTTAWNAWGVQEQAKLAAGASRWAPPGFLRVWTPERFGTWGEDGQFTVAAEDIPSALAKVRISAPYANAATVYVDKETGAEALVFIEGTGDNQAAEVCYDDGTGETVIRRISARGTVETRLPLGGLALLAPVRGKKLITEAVRAEQRRLNFAETVLNRVLELAGFPERYITDAEPSGPWKKLAEGQAATPGAVTRRAESGGIEELIPEPRTIGGSTTTELYAVVDTDRDGKKTPRAVTVQKFEPTDPEYCIKAARHAYGTILEDCHQGHKLSNSDGRPSGRSREEARADFEADAQGSRTHVETAIRNVLTVAFILAELMAKKPGHFTARLRIVVDIDVDTGPASSEEMTTDATLVEKGLMAKETAMGRAGIEDPVAEEQRIQEALRQQPEFRGKLAGNLTALVAALPEGDPVELAIAAGYAPEEARARFGHIVKARAQKAG
jgi:hypothetical protein